LLLIATGALACGGEPWPEPPLVTQEQFLAGFDEWRETRRSRLVTPGSGAVTWIGLWELDSGSTAMGADSTLPIVLPEKHAPRVAGTIERAGSLVRFNPAAGARVSLADSTLVTEPVVLASDRSAQPTVLARGSMRMRVHGEPGTDRLWLRAWDESHPAMTTFRLPDSYPPDLAWRVAARFDRYAEPRDYRVSDIVEGTQSYISPGELVFRVKGREYRLAVSADSSSRSLFVMLWDSTATTTTYEAGRYVRVPLPDERGWTVIDFNQTYNPPCVFTPFSTCAFPPPENRLNIWITAGEKRVSAPGTVSR
jgi:uncharacterized protein (DUF1684 family)